MARNSKPPLEENICAYIFSVSAAMVGVCLTVIGLLRVVITVQKTGTFADDLVAFDGLLFLTSCLTSYWAMRRRDLQRLPRLEHFADAVFVLALILMVFSCGFITYAVT